MLFQNTHPTDMCFSVNVNLVKEELENRFGATLIDPDKYRPSYYYHAFSLPDMPAICSGTSGSIKLLKWGLIPSWTRNSEEAKIIRYKTFNARADSIQDKPSFSESFKTKRCLIPVKGFFEWQHVGKDKIPWYIYRTDNEVLSLAGLYNVWNDSATGELISTFSIITTEANDLMAKIHNAGKRMPVVLEREAESSWIDTTISLPTAFGLLKPLPGDILSAHTIGPVVNDKYAERNTPEIIKPYQYYTNNLLF
jgi:putative SOS response-associated peptidase YedK